MSLVTHFRASFPSSAAFCARATSSSVALLFTRAFPRIMMHIVLCFKDVEAAAAESVVAVVVGMSIFMERYNKENVFDGEIVFVEKKFLQKIFKMKTHDIDISMTNGEAKS
jgi:hypothetical protein